MSYNISLQKWRQFAICQIELWGTGPAPGPHRQPGLWTRARCQDTGAHVDDQVLSPPLVLRKCCGKEFFLRFRQFKKCPGCPWGNVILWKNFRGSRTEWLVGWASDQCPVLTLPAQDPSFHLHQPPCLSRRVSVCSAAGREDQWDNGEGQCQTRPGAQ